MDADGLFVHGSLREGGRDHAWLQRTRPEGRTRAWAPGRLFHLPQLKAAALVPGPIPGALPPGPGWVVGDFVGYADPEDLDAALANLDPLEGLDQGRTERRLLPVLLDSGHTYVAWVYAHPEDRLPRLEREGVELTQGDWAAYL